MKRRVPHLRTVLVLLALTLILWIAAILFLFRVSPFFHAVLIKRLGMVPVLGTMFLCPLVALVLSARMMIRGSGRSARVPPASRYV